MKTPNAPKGAQRPIPWYFSSIIAVLWIFLTLWNTANVGEGIVALGLFSGRSEILIYAFAFALAGGVSVTWALLPIFFWSPASKSGIEITVTRTIAGIFLTALSVMVTNFEAFHSVLISVRNSQGSNMVVLEQKELLRLNEQITKVSDQVVGVYKNRLTSLGELAAAAGRGQDRTRIPSCGSICQGRWDKLAELMEKFGDLAMPIERHATNETDARSTYLDTLNRSKLLLGQVRRLGEFHKYADGAAVPASIATGLDEVLKAVEAKTAKYDDLLAIDDKSLAIQATVAVFSAAWRLDFASIQPVLLFSLLYPSIPFAMTIALSLLSWRIHMYNDSFSLVDELAQEVEQEQEAKEQLEKLAELKKSTWRARLIGRFYDRKPKGDGYDPAFSPA